MRVLAFFLALSLLISSGPRVHAANSRYQLALPGYQFAFPRDHGSHPPYSTEWWYYTGHLKSKSGQEFGFQATWFRTALSPTIKRQSKWATRDIYFAHFALTDVSGKRFYFSDKIGRGALGLSGADAGKAAPRIHVGDWNLQFGSGNGNTQNIRLSGTSDQNATRGKNFGIRLAFQALKNPTIQGERGVSQKSAGVGRASHYYSFCRLSANGQVQLDGQTFQVTGQSWFDHEFGSSQLEPDQTGWDWFSIQLDDGRELMLYHLRLTKNRVEPLSSGTLIERDGRTRHLKLSDFRLTPVGKTTTASGTSYPTSWKIEIPSINLSLTSTPALPDQELRPVRSGVDLSYWEGLISLQGTAKGKPITGHGYLELTGYAKSFAGTF